MITKYRTLLAILCCFTIAVPIGPAQVQESVQQDSNGQFYLGLGGVSGNCEFSDQMGRDACYRGGRFVAGLGIDLFSGWDLIPDPGSTSRASGSKRSSNRSGGNFHLPSGRGGEVVVLILGAVLVVYGIWWLLFSLVSSTFKLSLQYSSDLRTSHYSKPKDSQDFENYQVDKIGTKMSIYLVKSWSFAISSFVGYTQARLQLVDSGSETAGGAANDTLDEEKSSITKKIEGVSTTVSMGLFPRAVDSGFFVYAEYEREFFPSGNAREWIEDRQKSPTGLTKRNLAFVAGYAF